MRDIQWRWVLASVGFIYGSQLIMPFLAQPFGAMLDELRVMQALFLTYTVASYFFGGFGVVLLSPGKAASEPGIAALAAIALDVLLPPRTAAQMAAAPWLVIVMTGFLLALVGGWIGQQVKTPGPSPLSQPTSLLGILALVFLAFLAPVWIVSVGTPLWAATLITVAGGALVYRSLSKVLG